MAERRIRIHLEVCGLEQLQSDLKLLADAAESSLEVRDALFCFFGSSGEAAGIEFQQCSTAAGDLRIELKLSHGLAVLAAALRAGDFDGL